MLKSLALQLQIIQALAFRDLRERIRRNPLGVVGLLLEPLLAMALFLLLRVLLRQGGIDWMNPVLQLGSGFILYYLFSRLGLAALNGIKPKDRSVLLLSRVKPLDLLMARGMVEVQLYGTSLFVLLLAVSLYQWQVPVDDPGAAVGVFLLLAFTALGVGLMALMIGRYLQSVKFLIQLVLNRLLFWTSGLFFTVALLPGYLRPWFLWNPLLHGIELFRHALAPTYPIPGISLPYLMAWAFGGMGLSLFVYGNHEELLMAEEETR
jgi:capsular polysaccharide transport system permease protein